jgi:hypothetical protein
VTGCGGVETAHHLFMSCPVLASLWCLVRDWVDTSWTDPFQQGATESSPLFHAASMVMLHLGGVARTNSRIFKANESTTLQMLDKVRVHFFWWMKAYNANIYIYQFSYVVIEPFCLFGCRLIDVWM